MMLDDEYFMRQALLEAEEAYRQDEVPIGAVLVYGNMIISRAHNQTEQLKDPTAHAELLCISAASTHLNIKYLKQCKLYVTVEPCAMCAGAIRWSRVSELVWGAREDKFGYHNYSSDIIPSSCKVRGGVLEAEAKALMQSFFQKKRR